MQQHTQSEPEDEKIHLNPLNLINLINPPNLLD